MIIKSYLEKNPRKKFLIASQKDDISIKSILKTINSNSLGFCVVKVKSKFKILTDGDFRRAILKNYNFIQANSKKINFKQLYIIDINETMYKAYRLMNKKQINSILVSNKKK